MERRSWDISWISLWRLLFFVAFVALLFLGRNVLAGLFLALVISSGLEFLVTFLERRGFPRTLSVIIIFLLGAIVLVAVAYTVVPFVIADFNTILSKVNKTAARYWLGPLLNFQGDQSLGVFLNRVSGQLFSGNISPLATLADVLGGFGLAVAVLVSSFYLSLSRDGVDRFIRAILPTEYEESALRIYHRSRRQIGFWFRTQVVMSIIVGLLTWVALFLLGVKHSFILAIFAAVVEIVPFVGPILAGAAAVITAFTASPALALYTLLAFLAIQQFESHVLVPVLMRRAVGLHPVIVITSLLMGIQIGGFMGALVAVPAAAVLQEVTEEWSRKKGKRLETE
jgi:predicted PurR-regulated permease PerM